MNTKCKILIVLCVLAVVLTIGCSSGGGGSSSGGGGGLTISGDVSDETNTVVPGASVTVRRSDHSQVVTTVTSTSGSFTLTNIPANTDIYINVSKTSYAGTNTEIFPLTASISNVNLMIITGTAAKSVADAYMGSTGGSSWTDPAYASKSWFFFVMQDSFGATYPGFYTSVTPSGPTVLYNNGADTYVPTGPTVAGSPNLPDIGGHHSSTGVFTVVLSSSTATRSVKLPLVLGEFSGDDRGP